MTTQNAKVLEELNLEEFELAEFVRRAANAIGDSGEQFLVLEIQARPPRHFRFAVKGAAAPITIGSAVLTGDTVDAVTIAPFAPYKLAARLVEGLQSASAETHRMPEPDLPDPGR